MGVRYSCVVRGGQRHHSFCRKTPDDVVWRQIRADVRWKIVDPVVSLVQHPHSFNLQCKSICFHILLEEMPPKLSF